MEKTKVRKKEKINKFKALAYFRSVQNAKFWTESSIILFNIQQFVLINSGAVAQNRFRKEKG